MEIIDRLLPFGTYDRLALAIVLGCWFIIGWVIEHPPASRPSVSKIMQMYRHEWMCEFITREPRIFDASMLDTLRQGTAFFASASMIAIGGGVALMGNPNVVLGMAGDLALPADATALRFRVLLVIAFLANALLKFIWSHRLFGYCAIVMAAAPNDPKDPKASHRATQAGDINVTAAKSFNRGLHSIYFALGSLAWMLGPMALIFAALLTSAMLVRREFASASRAVMLRDA
jgi:uncharacterized membrane protein